MVVGFTSAAVPNFWMARAATRPLDPLEYSIGWRQA
jgi:hypothetical protein